MTRRPAFLTSPLLEAAGVPHLFTTRHSRGSSRGANGGRPSAPRPGALRSAGSRRTAGLRSPGARSRGRRGPRGWSRRRRGRPHQPAPRPAASVFTADCLPIVLFDPDGRRLAVVHAGWRGTVQSVARAAVTALTRAGAPPEGLLAAVGPSIGPCCYEVDLPVIERLRTGFPSAWPTWVTPVGPGKWMLDLWKANEDQLARRRGAVRIENPRLCTACRLDLFFSYRREGKGGSLATVAAVLRRPEPPSRLLKRPICVRWRPRPHAQRTARTPRVRPSGAASHLDLLSSPQVFPHPAGAGRHARIAQPDRDSCWTSGRTSRGSGRDRAGVPSVAAIRARCS